MVLLFYNPQSMVLQNTLVVSIMAMLVIGMIVIKELIYHRNEDLDKIINSLLISLIIMFFFLMTDIVLHKASTIIH